MGFTIILCCCVLSLCVSVYEFYFFWTFRKWFSHSSRRRDISSIYWCCCIFNWFHFRNIYRLWFIGRWFNSFGSCTTYIHIKGKSCEITHTQTHTENMIINQPRSNRFHKKRPVRLDRYIIISVAIFQLQLQHLIYINCTNQSESKLHQWIDSTVCCVYFLFVV